MDFSSIGNRPKVINFGCRLNICESETIEKIVCKLGLANYVIINSCAVTSEAERQVKQAIRKIHKENSFAKIIVTGCASEYDEISFKNLDGVVGVIKNSDKLNENSYLKFKENDASEIDYINKNTIRSFVQIQNGCDNFCTYCLIRKVRGKSLSLSPQIILEMIDEELQNPNVKEIVLTGVNISSYNFNGLNLTNLCKFILSQRKNIQRLRLSSLDPADLDSEFIDFVVTEKRLMPHIHLSVQSGDDMILKRMRRRHTSEDVIKLTSDILEKRSEFIFGADFICGFPTETDVMAQNTETFFKNANITLAHIFPYSERPGTPAALMPQVEKKVRKERARRLIDISNSMLDKKLQDYIGQNINILAETLKSGKMDNFIPVITNDEFKVGKNQSALGKAVINHQLLVEVL